MKKQNKKLQLNKEVIARLNDDSMKNIRGGIATDALIITWKASKECPTKNNCTAECKTNSCKCPDTDTYVRETTLYIYVGTRDCPE